MGQGQGQMLFLCLLEGLELGTFGLQCPYLIFWLILANVKLIFCLETVHNSAFNTTHETNKLNCFLYITSNLDKLRPNGRIIETW